VENVTLSSSLTTNSEAFSGPTYYALFEVIAPVEGDYIIRSDSTMDISGRLYRENFYPESSEINAIQYDDDGGGNLQFQIKTYLRNDSRYVLLVTTVQPNVTGNFGITVSGLNQVRLREINSSSIISTTTSTTGKYIEYK
jgi:hypothetical protein